MKIKVNFDGMFLGIKVNESKEGKKYYKLNIMIEDEVGSISCTENVYNKYLSGSVQKMSDVTVEANINMQYGSLMIVDIL